MPSRLPEAVAAWFFMPFGALQESMDVWALGVLAFELLTGHTALKVHEGKEKVRVCCCTVMGDPAEFQGGTPAK